MYVPAVTLKKDEEIIIEPMSIIPVDCFVLEGNTVVDEATMTGESFPASKTVGSFLMSGTQNISSRIVAVVTSEQHESTLERLIDNISTATEQTSNADQNVDLVVRHFVAGILFLASFGFAISFYTFQGASLHRYNAAAQRAMAILAASCPCALGLAGPSASMAGLGSLMCPSRAPSLCNTVIDAAWTRGILLVGGARTLERLDTVTACVMDKTGTLTEGILHVDNCQFEDGVDRQLCYHLLFLAEKEIAQSHPAGKAVFQFALRNLQLAEDSSKAFLEIENYSYTPGRGASCTVRTTEGHHHSILVGSKDFLAQSEILLASPLVPEGSTECNKVLFALNGKFGGYLSLQV